MSGKGLEIAPAEGRLGILLVGLGAVSTTFIAGVLAVRRGLGKPIGSLTQMGTVRLGKRTENRVPKIADFVPLVSLADLEFGAWDIFPDDAYEAAKAAEVLERELIEALREQITHLGLDYYQEAAAAGEAASAAEVEPEVEVVGT